MPLPARDPLERFWAMVRKGKGCWEWQGSRLPRGYGSFRLGTRSTDPKEYAHRIAWAWKNGPIPLGMRVLHHCDNPGCVRPDHLFLGTQADNVADMDAKGRRVNPSSLKTHCPQGHPYDDANTCHYRGERRCRACNRQRTRALRAIRKAG